MKKFNCCLLILFLAGFGAAEEKESKPVEWGAENCGVKMSIRLATDGAQFRPGQKLEILVWIKSESAGVVRLWDARPESDFAVLATSPSGKKLSSKFTGIRGDEEFRRTMIRIEPEETYETRLDITGAFAIEENGKYRLALKRNVIQQPGKFCQVESNTLTVAMKR